ncbi:MAG: hypothetical protein HOV80_14535 [Polyangiaceae bacterium]|nr:hypothetical protein [Polyangiaceae bacterium]
MMRFLPSSAFGVGAATSGPGPLEACSAVTSSALGAASRVADAAAGEAWVSGLAVFGGTVSGVALTHAPKSADTTALHKRRER